MAFFEKFSGIRQYEIVRDPMTTVPVVARGEGDMPIGVYVLEFSHRSILLRLGKQVLLDNQIKGTHPEDIVVVVCRSVVSQEVLSSASVIGTSRWRYLRISLEHLSQASLEGRLGRNYEFSPDPPARRPARLLEPPQHRKGRVKDCPADPQRVEAQRRIKDHPANPRRVEVPAPARYLQRLDLMKKILLD